MARPATPPLSAEVRVDLAVAGPMARSAEDLALSTSLPDPMIPTPSATSLCCRRRATASLRISGCSSSMTIRCCRPPPLSARRSMASRKVSQNCEWRCKDDSAAARSRVRRPPLYAIADGGVQRRACGRCLCAAAVRRCGAAGGRRQPRRPAVARQRHQSSRLGQGRSHPYRHCRPVAPAVPRIWRGAVSGHAHPSFLHDHGDINARRMRSTAAKSPTSIRPCGQARQRSPDCRRRQCRSGAAATACRSTCRPSAPVWRTARQSLSLNLSSATLAASSRHPGFSVFQVGLLAAGACPTSR